MSRASRGKTPAQRFRGMNRASAANQARSAGSYRTRPACRRSTAFSCRSTSSSASFADRLGTPGRQGWITSAARGRRSSSAPDQPTITAPARQPVSAGQPTQIEYSGGTTSVPPDGESCWSRGSIARHLRERGLAVSRSTVGRVLAEARIRAAQGPRLAEPRLRSRLLGQGRRGLPSLPAPRARHRMTATERDRRPLRD